MQYGTITSAGLIDAPAGKSLTLQSRIVLAGGDPSGPLLIKTGNTNDGAPGAISIIGGHSVVGDVAGADILIRTGGGSGTQSAGTLTLQANGGGTSSAGGKVVILSGVGGPLGGDGGSIGLTTGGAPAGNTGSISLFTANAPAGDSGSIHLFPGTASGTAGGVLISMKSGATQAAAGAAGNELWKTLLHATLPDNVVMIGA